MRNQWILGFGLLTGLAGCVAPSTDGTVTELNHHETLFDDATFGGNGRTCATCHGETAAGTISPEGAQARFAANPNDPLFRSIDSDDGVGNSYTRLLTRATIRVTIQLPANVEIEGSSARSVTLMRSVPSTLNTPALDPVLMWDGRAPTLQAQAAGAVHDHYQPTITPSPGALNQIAEYERTLFSSPVLEAYANGGPAPTLPPGNTDAEKRGRAFFVGEFDGAHPESGICAACHRGPMLNETGLIPAFQPNVGAGVRLMTAWVSELNDSGLPTYTFIFHNADGSSISITSPDPGRALITGDPADADGQHCFGACFKTPTLWNTKNSAPYFHDGSAQTLEQLMNHYQRFFAAFGVPFTPDQQADAIAYLKLL